MQDAKETPPEPFSRARSGNGRFGDPLSMMLDDIRLSGAIMTDAVLAPGLSYSFDTAGLAAVYIVRRGTAEVQVPGQPTQILQPADLLLVTGGGARHRIALPSDASVPRLDIADILSGRVAPPQPEAATVELTCGTFRYDAELAAPLMAALPPAIRFHGTGEAAPLWLVIGLGFVEQERAKPRPATQAVINRLIDILLIECLRAEIERIPPDAAGWLAALRDPNLSAVLASMHQTPAHAWTVPELATIAHMSRSAFAARFSAALGQTPMAYLSQLRLRIGMQQLRHSSRPVKAIATALGYSSTVGFNQAFRKAFGVPPSAIRSQPD